MASDRVPAADDLTPVLIYVIIKVSFIFFNLLWGGQNKKNVAKGKKWRLIQDGSENVYFFQIKIKISKNFCRIFFFQNFKMAQ
jgi:hypothetical protein